MMSARERRMRRLEVRQELGEPGDGYIETADDKLSFSSADVHRLSQGVSTQWLAKAFRLTRYVVEKKLVGVAPISTGRYNQPLYDLPTAASYLLPPRVDVKGYLKTAKTSELPEHLREAVWNAKLKSQRWEEKAGHLWRTENVMAFFGEILADVRDKLQLIPDRVERLTGLSIEQYRLIRNTVDEVQEEIYDRIIDISKRTTIQAQIHEEGLAEEDDGTVTSNGRDTSDFI